jgi:hypothetical protein
MRSPDEVQAEIDSLSALIREPQEEGVARSLIAARESLLWAVGLAGCRPTDFIIEPVDEFDAVEMGQRVAKALGQRGGR